MTEQIRTETLLARKQEIYRWTNEQTPTLQSFRRQLAGYTFNASEYSMAVRNSITIIKEKLGTKATNISRCNALLNDLTSTTDQERIQALCQRFEELMAEIIEIDKHLTEKSGLFTQLRELTLINDQLNSMSEYQRHAAQDIGQTNYAWPWL